MSDPGTVTVTKTAALARLAITPEEALRFGKEFEQILAYFRSLAELDVTGAEALARAGGEENVLRVDEPRSSIDPGAAEALLERAPARIEGFFSVPKTIGGPG